MCNGDKAKLLEGVLVATPVEPTLMCCDCQTKWRINLYEVEDKICLDNK
jgi:hypothetical protein